MEEKKSCQIHFRITPSENKKLRENAKAAKLSLNQYITAAINEKKIYVVDCVPDMVYEISKIGANINQIARVGNSQKYVSREQLKEVQSCMDELIAMVKKLLEALYEDNDELKDLKALNKSVKALSERIEQNGDSRENKRAD